MVAYSRRRTVPRSNQHERKRSAILRMNDLARCCNGYNARVRKLVGFVLKIVTGLSFVLCTTTAVLWTWDSISGRGLLFHRLCVQTRVLLIDCGSGSILVQLVDTPSVRRLPPPSTWGVGYEIGGMCPWGPYRVSGPQVWDVERGPRAFDIGEGVCGWALRGGYPPKVSTQCRYAVFPYWFALAISAILPSQFALVRLLRRHRKLTGRCPSCGYDLRATPAHCPECGQTIDADHGSGHLVS